MGCWGLGSSKLKQEGKLTGKKGERAGEDESRGTCGF